MGPGAERSLLGRTSPLVKVGLATAWLVALATTVDPRPGIVLAVVAIGAMPILGGVRLGQLGRGVLPLVLAAGGLGLANLLFAAANADPAATELARIGPLRLTLEGGSAALGLVARIVAVAAAGAAFALTTTATRLADALVQQARLSPRFAYGALAAYEAVPGLAADFATLRAARRLRGLPAWYPRILVGMLVRAIRRADQLALAMDARGFGSGPRSTYRPISWRVEDLVVALGGLTVLVVVLVLAH
ncbi:MAG TPA: energy-coupling factor transporter transmembrane component T [Candidatus Binatus sp.]|nr:energy-coupling factor transporter transmembrane component T [Candidatus Binatus sp.]